MKEYSQFPPALLARALGLWVGGRVHGGGDHNGTVRGGPEEFVAFRKVIRDPRGDEIRKPRAQLIVTFRFARFSQRVNRILSLIPIPFIVAQRGFRSKTWFCGKETGAFMGRYEWETVEDAQRYCDSFPMKLMKRCSIPETLKCEISELRT